MNLKRNAEYLIKLLKPIAETLDQLQKDTIKISDAVYHWKKLGENYTGANASIFIKRYESYITNAHLAAFELSPRYSGRGLLSNTEQEKAMSFIEENFSITFPSHVLMRFKAKLSPFRSSLFGNPCQSTMTDHEWWKTIRSFDNEDILKDKDCDIIAQLMTAVASSSGIERTFSKFGLIHTKLRNSLGVQKAAKLVFASQAE